MTDRIADESEIPQRLRAAEAVLGHTFADRALLRMALTHTSFLPDDEHAGGYERLEFLGDAVLDLVVCDEIFRRFPELPEGAMTRVKIGAVSGPSLVTASRELGLEDLVLVGKSELATGGRGMDSVLEDVFEALVAALYVDGGLPVAAAFVLSALASRISPSAALVEAEHPKSALQEYLQARRIVPEYRIVAETGPIHARTFTAEVLAGETMLGSGSGGSKKEAERAAALEALRHLGERL